MPESTKETIIDHITLEICGFGSLNVALRIFRRHTGNDSIRKYSELKEYLQSLPEEELRELSKTLDLRLVREGYPKGI